MALRQPQFSKEEFARLGDEIYERDIYPQLQPGSASKIVAVDISTGTWEIDDDEISACNRLEKLYPNAQRKDCTSWFSVCSLIWHQSQ